MPSPDRRVPKQPRAKSGPTPLRRLEEEEEGSAPSTDRPDRQRPSVDRETEEDDAG